jgi:hypothetical protein
MGLPAPAGSPTWRWAKTLRWLGQRGSICRNARPMAGVSPTDPGESDSMPRLYPRKQVAQPERLVNVVIDSKGKSNIMFNVVVPVSGNDNDRHL